MSDPQSILLRYFGHSEFRPLQKEIVESILSGRDTIALLPTGGGKSVCFQVPALIREGLCIVVTPLIALMKDQVENLRAKDIPALALYSGMSRKEMDFELENCVNGKYKFLYVSPERLQSKNFLSYAIHMPLNLIAVDEAHCISQWGYDFRPPYLQIAGFREKFGKLPCIALTASATPAVLKDIEEKLKLIKAAVFRKSFTRPNLAYAVLQEEDKGGRILSLCRKIKGSGLVYVRSRKKTLEMAGFLNRQGIQADYYHAGLEAKIREEKQESWKKNKTRVMVCTNAFGMGIDKPDVRFVIHEQKTDSLEAYYQEAGRAGRDGQKAYCILLSHESDFAEDQRNTEQKYPSVKDISRVYELICNYLKIAVGSGAGQSYPFEISELCTYFSVSPTLVYNALRILEADGYLMASEAVYLPSRMKFLCSYDALYDWQLKSESLDAVSKMLLRSYGGLFDHYTPIYEYDIARRLQKSERWIREQLEKYKEAGIIDYIPRNNKPLLQFLENRFSSVHIDAERIGFLRKQYLEKLEFVNSYVRNRSTCRSRALVAYFGENDAEDCGICDLCQARKNKLSEQEKFELYSKKIQKMAEKGPFRMVDLKNLLKNGEPEEYLGILRWLNDHGMITEIQEGYWQWRGKKH